MKSILKSLIIVIILFNYGQKLFGNVSPAYNVLQNFNFLQQGRNWSSWGEKPTYEVRDRFNRIAVAKGIGAIEQAISVVPNTTYTILVGMKVKKGTKVRIGVKGVTHSINEQTIEVEGTSDYQSLFGFNIETGDLNNLVVYVYRPYADSNIEIDFVSFGPAVNQDVYPNLVKNPSFETGDLSNWSKWLTTPEIANLPENKYDGKKGVKITGKSSLSQNVATVPGKTYRFIAFSKVKSGSHVNIGLKPSLEAREIYRTNRHSDAWTRSEIFFTASEALTNVYAFVPNDGHEAVVDNFIVYEVDSAERIANGSFVSNHKQYGLSNWTKSFYRVEVKKDGFSRNVNSIVIPGGTSITQAIPTLSNSSYILTADLKSYNNKDIKYGFKVVYQDNTNTVYDFTLNNQGWTKVSHSVRTKNTPIKSATFFIETPEIGEKGEVANVSLKLISTEADKAFPLTEEDILANSFNANPVKLYPNPCTDTLNVQLNGEYSSLTLYNLAGQVIYQQPIKGSGVVTLSVAHIIPPSTPFLVNLTGRGTSKTLKGISK